MRTTVTALRRKLKPGVEFQAEFIGQFNLRNCDPGVVKTRRRVLKQHHKEMCSIILDGSKAGEDIYLDWRKVTVTAENDTTFILTKELIDGSTDTFLRITLLPESPAV